MKKKNNKSKIYGFVISVVLFLITIISTFMIIKLNVLPFKYLLIFIIIGLVSLGIIYSIFRIKKKKSKLRIVLSVIATIFSIIYLIGFLYLNKTFNFFDKILSDNLSTENYIVVVNNSASISKIEDLKEKNIGFAYNEAYHLDKALETLKEKVNFNSKENEDYNTLLDNLYNNSIDALIIEKSYKDLLVNSEDSNYSDFDDKTKIIYEFEIKYETEDFEKAVDVLKNNFNVYISGIDTFGKISSVSRSDVNIVMSINPKTNQILLITIPRDFYVRLDGTTGYKDKLTHAGIYGVEKSVKTIENLLNIDINYYIKVNFTSLIKIVDSIGGVDVYSEYSFSGEKYTFTKGYNRMNGEQALEFSRTRKTVVGGDRTRGKNQEAVIAAIIKKICSPTIITNYTSILDSLSQTFTTNMTQDKITDLIKMQLNENKNWNINSTSLNGTDAYEYTYSYRHQKLYVMVPLQSSLDNATTLLNKLKNNEALDSSYIEASSVSETANKTKTEKKEEDTNIKEQTVQETNTEQADTNNQENNTELSNCTLVDGVCLEDYEEVVETN